MKRFLSFLVFAVLLGGYAMAYDFSAVCESGQTLYYIITSSTDPYTVEVVHQNSSSPYYNTYPAGNLTIPSFVSYNDRTYSVTSIGSSAFYCCSGLTSVTIPNSVTSIGESAFSRCSGLTSVTIGNSVEIIGYDAFYYCSGLTTVNFNATNCTTMGSLYNLVFSGCTSLTTLNIGETVTNIPAYAFYICSGLTSVTIPNSVTSIGNMAFMGCSGLTELTIGNSVASIGDSAFFNCSGLTGDLIIPDSVTSIGDRAFYNCDGLTSVTIGNSVTSVGEFAFGYCSGLSIVNFNATNCTTMSINGASGGISVFHGCNSLSTVNIGENVTNIPGGAFLNCSTLSGELIIPNSVTRVGSRAFEDCEGLTSVTIGNSVESYGRNAFGGCSGVTTMNYNATNCPGFRCECTSLVTLNIGENVTNIPSGAFNNCSGLTVVYYAGTIAQWCGITFGNSSAQPLSYAHNLYINNCLVADLVIPNTVEEIKAYAFYGATCLSSVSIPSSVTSIGNSAFYNCEGLASVTIGNSVTNIGSGAFGNCIGMTSVTSLVTNPPIIYSNTFDLVNTNIPVYVPCGCVSAYNNANGWNYFTNIQQNPDCTTDIEENIIEELDLYPNPVVNILTITSSEAISEIEIVNVMGQVVKHIEVNADNAVCNVEGLKSGVYVVRIRTLRQAQWAVISQRKFIKE